MKTYKYDGEIVDLVHSIMNNGTFHAENINESLLYKFMELRGTPLTLDENAYNRDTEADWIMENPFNIRDEVPTRGDTITVGNMMATFKNNGNKEIQA